MHTTRYRFRGFFLLAELGILLLVLTLGQAADQFAELDPKRIEEIKMMLPEKPAGFGQPYTDRAFWTAPHVHPLASHVVGDAEKFLHKDFPAWDDNLYLDFSKTGQRPPGEAMIDRRREWLLPLVIMECIENKGRFLPTINKILNEYVDEPTWTLPAHDRDLSNFHRKTYSVDLRSSAVGADLAQALYLLDNQIDPKVRQRVMAAVEERVFMPIRNTLITGKGHGWMGRKSSPVQNNWNAVCLAGVVGAARTILPDRYDRAVFVTAGEHYSIYFLNGFRNDGYCDEGAGYWNYGFGNFINLREILINSTGGHIDLFANPKISNIAMFGARFQMVDHIVPPFADCRFGTKANLNLVTYCNEVLKLGLKGYELAPVPGRANLATILMRPTHSVVHSEHTAKENDPIGLRSFFDQAGVLVCRPLPNSQCHLGAAIKAGGNSSHSHNDIGSFVIALNGELPVGEPGGPHAYNNKTFGPERYTYKILNSFGHPVPVVAGKLQKDATKVHPKVISTRFTDEEDEISMDISSAYDVPELRKLVRTMRYFRKEAGLVTIEDSVKFSKPQSFEITLPTRGSYKQVDARTIEFAMGKERIVATIETPVGFELTNENIQELGSPAFARLGLKLAQPITSATVKVTFRPAP